VIVAVGLVITRCIYIYNHTADIIDWARLVYQLIASTSHFLYWEVVERSESRQSYDRMAKYGGARRNAETVVTKGMEWRTRNRSTRRGETKRSFAQSLSKV